MNRLPALLLLIAGLQTATTLPLPAGVSPERAQALRARFTEGCRLVEQNRLEPALEIFAEILREDPQARGSLLMSGLVENRRFRFASAADHLQRFMALEPQHEQGLIGLIKALHSNNRAADAEPYRLRLHHLRSSGKSEKLRAMASFERQIIPLADGQWISAQEYFEEADLRPRWAWLLMKNEQTIARRLSLNRLSSADSAELQSTQPSLGPGRVYALSETLYEKGESRGTKIHRLLPASSTFAETTRLATEILTSAP